MSPDRRPGLRAWALAIALAIIALGSVGPAQDMLRLVPAQQPLEPPAFVLNDQQFESWVFQNTRNAAAARQELEAQIQARINDLNRDCDLTDEQATKLRLAARGDIERFFARVDQKRDQLQGKSFEQQKINDAFQEIAPLQQEYQAGLFGDDALLTKVTATILDPEQAARHEETLREREAFSYQSKVDNFIAQLRLSLGLTDAQCERFAGVIREETRPPRRLSSQPAYERYLLIYQISRVPEETLRPIFDDVQWQVLRSQLDQAERLIPALRAQGLINDEDEDSQ